MDEPERFREDGMKNAQTPYSLVIKTYWRRLLAVGGVWFLYNFLVYPFNMYSSYILDIIIPPEEVYIFLRYSNLENPGQDVGVFHCYYVVLPPWIAHGSLFLR
jgi:hypothetical protein